MKSVYTLFLFTLIFFYAESAFARDIPSPIYGVTIDNTENLDDIIDALDSLDFMPTTRIVFDEFIPATDYLNATKEISQVSYIMGEILDSFYMKSYDVQQFRERTQEYVDTLGEYVDIWEIGNEINGEWLGDTPDVIEKMSSAYSIIKESGGITELTLYYNEGCWAKESHEMFRWAEENISAEIKSGLDYVFISYYEDDCENLQPDWPEVFQRLEEMFPHSKIGMGEVGTKFAEKKEEFINRYYVMQIDSPRYVGGYFWWYFYQDMVPKSKNLWNVLNAAVSPDKREIPSEDTQDEKIPDDNEVSSFCHKIKGPTDMLPAAEYAAPFSFFSSTRQVFISIVCHQGATANVGTGSPLEYIYRDGYASLDNKWEKIELTGANMADESWFVGSATGEIPENMILSEKDNYFVAYVCQWMPEEKEWKCGCRDEKCLESFWNLQIFSLE